jgi:hypothetical protein
VPGEALKNLLASKIYDEFWHEKELAVMRISRRSNSIASCLLASFLAVALSEPNAANAGAGQSPGAYQYWVGPRETPVSDNIGNVTGLFPGTMTQVPGPPTATVALPQIQTFIGNGYLDYTNAAHYLYKTDWDIPGFAVNEFFPESAYGTDCSTLSRPAFNFENIHLPAEYACNLTSAPVVDMAWVAANLDAKGYTYKIDYPHSNPNNGRAVISWAKGCVGGPFTWTDGEAMQNLICWHGMARLEGAGWQAWPPIPGSSSDGYASNVASYVLVWKWPLCLYGADIQDGIPCDPTVVSISDDWLTQQTPPPLPQLPPPTASLPPPPINVGAPGDPSAAGAGNTVSISRNVIPFDKLTFCEVTGPDGNPRSAAWIANCVANAE